MENKLEMLKIWKEDAPIIEVEKSEDQEKTEDVSSGNEDE